MVSALFQSVCCPNQLIPIVGIVPKRSFGSVLGSASLDDERFWR